MHGDVVWYDQELRVALIARLDGFTIGTVERGQLAIGLRVQGDLRTPGPVILTELITGQNLLFTVEAEAMTEEDANGLLGFARG